MLIIAVAVVLCAAYLLWQLLEADLARDQPGKGGTGGATP